MDFDLKIISEEGDCRDPLFNCIMNAMNSMKEATADKIYQKIQKDGETNYSKPQVDRALASALKYGIFEVRNNRYRVRDDIRDDDGAVYWKLQKNKERTPFYIQEDSNEKLFGPKLDPEKDNQRFRRLIRKDSQECPHCGRIKKLVVNEAKIKFGKKETYVQPKKKDKTDKNFKQQEPEKRNLKRKERFELDHCEKPAKRKKNSSNESDQQNLRSRNWDKYNALLSGLKGDGKTHRQKKTYDSKYSETNMLQSSDYSFDSYFEENTNKNYDQNKNSESSNLSKCINGNDDLITTKSSSYSLKSDSLSEESETSSIKDDEDDDQSQGRTVDSFLESLPCTSQNVNDKVTNQYFNTKDVYDKSPMDQSKNTSDWLGCSEEPQSAIIQTNNVLTIEPMDSLAFKSLEQASYIS